MDNQSYLNQIAVKGKRTSSGEPLLSPLMIKLIIAGVIALITIIVVGVMVSSSNAKVTQSYERLYLRISQMTGNKGPYNKYAKFINSSSLAGHAIRLETSIANTNKSLEPLLGKLNVKKDSITKEVKNTETTSFNTYMSKLERASMSGQMDLYYSSLTAERIMQIITIEKQILNKTNNDSLKAVINNSLNDLEPLYDNFYDASNSLH